MNKIPPVGASIAAICASLVLVWALTGCKFFGADPAPPTAFERKFFDVQTNFIPVFVLQTNTISLTNTVIQFQTNTVGQIVLHTNELIIPVHSIVTVTQIHEAYTVTPNANATTGANVVGAIGNAVAPGAGGLVTGLITAGLLAWGKLRSSKKTNTTLVQGTETLLELIQALPNGSQNVSAAKQFLRTDQEDAGVRERIKDILKNDIDKGDAKVAAVEIKTEVDRLKS